MMALPALFKWEDCTPTQQIFPVLWYSCSKELYFWRVSCLSSFMLLSLETSFRFVAKRRSGSAPCCSFFFCICFYVVLHRSMEHIPFHLSPFQSSLCFIICRWKNDNLTNKGGSFYLNHCLLSGSHEVWWGNTENAKTYWILFAQCMKNELPCTFPCKIIFSCYSAGGICPSS